MRRAGGVGEACRTTRTIISSWFELVLTDGSAVQGIRQPKQVGEGVRFQEPPLFSYLTLTLPCLVSHNPIVSPSVRNHARL